MISIKICILLIVTQNLSTPKIKIITSFGVQQLSQAYIKLDTTPKNWEVLPPLKLFHSFLCLFNFFKKINVSQSPLKIVPALIKIFTLGVYCVKTKVRMKEFSTFSSNRSKKKFRFRKHITGPNYIGLFICQIFYHIAKITNFTHRIPGSPTPKQSPF